MSAREKWRKAAGLLLVVLILTLCATPQFRNFIAFPDHVRLPLGQAQDLALGIPLGTTVQANTTGGLSLDGTDLGWSRRLVPGAPFSIAALQTGQYTVDFKLFGLIPIRRMTVDVVPPVRVIPGGHSIGVQLKSRGVMVVGYAAVRDQLGSLRHPGKDAGIQLGDAIVEIDGHPVNGEDHAAILFEAAGRSGKPVPVVVRRQGKLVERLVSPVRERDSNRWRVGLYIRDGASGIGTLTFYDPVSGKYGALGHVIADGETSQAIEFATGHISSAEVIKIQRGKRSAPGEKIGSSMGSDARMGVIEKNTRFGIFGTISGSPAQPLYPEPIPAAMASQVREGPAEILTVLSGQKIERFQVEILRVMRQPTAEGKNMIVRVTDPRLLQEAGGIVQGMSGSPIIQDGKIVGAVTHVFVNDPTRGYGVLIEWMLQEAGLLKSNKSGTSLREVLLPGGLLCSGNVLVTRPPVYSSRDYLPWKRLTALGRVGRMGVAGK
ncbi:MAG: SpoIVB peptidase [Bacillota bacterium]